MRKGIKWADVQDVQSWNVRTNKPDLIGGVVEVLLDGVPQRKVVAFDIPRGFVVCLVVDEDGKTRLDEARERPLRERRNGEVRLMPRQEAT